MVELWHRVESDRVFLGGLIAAAFFGHNMQELRALQVAHVLQGADQTEHIVAIHRADVVKAQLFKQRPRHHHAFDMLFGPLKQLFNRRYAGKDLFAAFAQGGVELTGEQLRQMIIQRPDVLGDRHFIVIQHHQQVGFDIPGVVHRLKRHAGGNRPVANHAHRAPLFILFRGGDSHPDASGNGGGGVTDAQHVVLAFTAPREGVQAAFLANGADFVAAAGQNFMRVGLVTDVPDQAIEGRVIDVVQRHGQFHRAEARGKVTAGAADAVQQVAPQLITQLRQALFWQQAQLLGGIYQRQGRVFGNIKTHQRLIYCLFIALNNVIRERFQCRSIQRLCGQFI